MAEWKNHILRIINIQLFTVPRSQLTILVKIREK